ncbi:hypothetical protein DBR47_24355 [Paucibacter sp. KBW04]|nr:hypothetical protein DBR47_24355 [Paucibacter sp. KBW04]
MIVTPASAQFVKGNEAVQLMPDGSKRVETPPIPKTSAVNRLEPCLANAGCYPGPWQMVESKDGLVECTEAYARPGACRASSYGKTKTSRLWIVKSQGRWIQCQYPDLKSKCVVMFAPPPANLPYPAVQ